MERIVSTQGYLPKENVHALEALNIIEDTVLARIADTLRDMNDQPLRVL